LGFANRKLGRFEIAEDYYRQALASAPQHRGATEYYGELMVERGDISGAQQMLARLEAQCSFGCAEADELRRWIDAKRAPAS
jgi:Tfp pilus assembly protein PilF